MTQRPRAFRLDHPDVVTGAPDVEPARGQVVVTPEPDEIVEAADGTPVPMGERRGFPWLGVFFSALGALLSLGIGLAVDALVRDLFALYPGLGWVALGLVGAALVALLAVVGRELSGLMREQRIERLRTGAARAVETRDHGAACALAADLATLYAGRPEAARGRTRVADVDGEILDADDRLILAERELLAPLDDAATRIVANAAKQVSVVTALSPRAIVDVAFVVFAAARLLRQVSRVYGGRPGLLGFLRLGRAALGHLAVTGGVAVGDSLLQQVLGLGLAARVSAKLGEGVLNGLMTARFGLAAIAVCRPLPYLGTRPPTIGDVAGGFLPKLDRNEA
ncbi:YcjF family protein [Salinarimonas soli]|uniref:TIGR01620 family protein n=1 Tax=Salinarimonas soli TaxID=1638099 RepID=A0A5B2VC54_9HYPH|nr:TIGR01620 family protein [Salinarimonas soli]KAA2236295.1 TIGR01620 family protein [Salinarimonas soli]